MSTLFGPVLLRARPPASGALPPLQRRPGTALRENFKAQRSCDRDRLYQLDGNSVAQPVGLAGRVADQRMGVFLIAEVFRADGACRDEAVRTGVVEPYKQTRASDAADAAPKSRTNPVGEEMRDQTVVGFTLRLHGPPLRHRNRGSHLRQTFCIGPAGQAIIAEFKSADYRAVHHEVGIASDRRSEMCIAAQVQAKMSVIFCGVFSLRLRAQHHLVDQRLGFAAAYALKNSIELNRP